MVLEGKMEEKKLRVVHGLLLTILFSQMYSYLILQYRYSKYLDRK